MNLGDVPIGKTVHICSSWYIGKALVLEHDERSTICELTCGTTAEQMEYLRHGEVPPQQLFNSIHRIINSLEVSIYEDGE